MRFCWDLHLKALKSSLAPYNFRVGKEQTLILFDEIKQLSSDILPLTQMWWADGKKSLFTMAYKDSIITFKGREAIISAPYLKREISPLAFCLQKINHVAYCPAWSYWEKNTETQMGPSVKCDFYIWRLCRQHWDCVSTTWWRRIVGSLLTSLMRTSCLWRQAIQI